jgi:hypothetical protein
MLEGLRTAIYHVGDLERAKGWCGEVLGKESYFDEPFYVGFDVGGFELGLQPDEGDAEMLAEGATPEESERYDPAGDYTNLVDGFIRYVAKRRDRDPE